MLVYFLILAAQAASGAGPVHHKSILDGADWGGFIWVLVVSAFTSLCATNYRRNLQFRKGEPKSDWSTMWPEIGLGVVLGFGAPLALAQWLPQYFNNLAAQTLLPGGFGFAGPFGWQKLVQLGIIKAANAVGVEASALKGGPDDGS